MTTKAKIKKDYSVSKDKTISFQLTVSSTEIKQEYQKVLKKAASNIEIKGFRKGKAPIELVEKELSLHKIYDEITQNLVPKKYYDFITKNKLNPIIDPQINLTNPPLSLEKDWNFDIKTCQQPESALKSYKTELKKINLKKYKDVKEHSHQILNLLASKSTVNVPQVLLDTQIKDRVSQLIDNASKSALTLDQYLKNNNTNIKDYQDKLKQEIINDWKTNLSLDTIATEQKIEVKPEDVAKVVPPQSSTEQQINYIYYLLRQKKTIDFLKTIK